jgi:DNA-binding response OmpR family regulator
MNSVMERTFTAPSPKAGRQTKWKLLLIDDDPAIRQLLNRLLTEEGYVVVSAANGFEAIEMAGNMQFDLVLLDLNMPLLDGWDTFQELTKKNPLMPFIVITARPNQLFPALASGTGALLEKPLDFVKLFSTIRALLNEPAKVHLARMVGRPAEFHYVPPKENGHEGHAGRNGA